MLMQERPAQGPKETISPATEMVPRYLNLRDRFQSEDALAPGEHPLIRIGALYHLARLPDHDAVRERLTAVLAAHDPVGMNGGDHDTALFCLHAAVLLAQQGDYAGVRWILQVLRD